MAMLTFPSTRKRASSSVAALTVGAAACTILLAARHQALQLWPSGRPQPQESSKFPRLQRKCMKVKK